MALGSNGRSHVEERGASSSEYGLLISLIALVVLAGIMALGTSVGGLYDQSCDEFVAATSGGAC